MNTAQNQMQQNTETQVGEEITQFSQSHEFFEDVRLDMADLLDMASNRGRQMSLEDAYNQAISMNPEISAIIQKRKDASIAQTHQQTVQAKEEAAGASLPSSGAAVGKTAPTTLRGALEDAWEGSAR